MQILSRSSGPEFDGFDPQQPGALIYRRTLLLPDDWAGQAVFFEIRRDIPTAEVFVDGQWVGKMDWRNNAVDISAACRPGQPVELWVLFRQGSLTGDAFLTCRPRGAHISDVFVQTLVRSEELRLQIELSGVAQPGDVQVTGRIYSEAAREGQPERTFFNQSSVYARPVQTLTVTWEWPNRRLWDVDQPNLFRLELSINGCGVADCVSQVFGFREFWIEGRRFFLNGREIRLRPVLGGNGDMMEWIDGQIDGFRWAGYNIAEIWPGGGSEGNCQLWYECADRKGFLITAPIGHIWDSISRWDEPGVQEAYEARLSLEQKRVRNHPSVVMWGTNGNVFGSGLGMDPRTLGIRKDAWYDTSFYRKRRAPIGEEMVAIIKKHDPTRPVFTHHGGGVGDVYTLNMYLNLIPLQEREEWLSAWVKQGEMPLMIVEFGTPLHVTFMRGRTDFPGAVTTEPLLTEYCAIYLGVEAYQLETPEYRAEIKRRFLGGQQYKNWQGEPVFDFAPNMQRIQALFSCNTWRAWRTMGITGGMIPWNEGHGWGAGEHSAEMVEMGSFQPGRRGTYHAALPRQALYGLRPEGSTVYPGGKAIVENNQSVLAWICGSEQAFTAKDHHFLPGETVHKTIALLNDTGPTQEYSGSYQVMLAGQQICCEQIRGTIPPGKTSFIPLSFTLPDTLLGDHNHGTIQFSLNLIGRAFVDAFHFQVFPKPQVVNMGVLTVFDPLGATRKMLQTLGYQVKEWDESEQVPLLIVGRCALSQGNDAILQTIEQYTRRGGRVIIMEQDPDWMHNRLGWRVAPHVTRRVFPVNPNHPVCGGLTADNLRDWNGESSLLPPYPEYSPEKTRLGKWWFPYYGYHWGNRGGVSSGMIEKPHLAGWRPILEGEFDLAYTPLMELDYGQGRVIWCSLDMEDRLLVQAGNTDPAAVLLLSHLIDYAQRSQLLERRPVYLAGSDADASWLSQFGLRFTCTQTFPAQPALLIIGNDDHFQDEDLKTYLQAGGNLFFLPRQDKRAPLGIGLEYMEEFGGSLEVPQWPECAGLSPSDLRWRTTDPAWLLKEGVEAGANGLLGRIHVGKGTAIFCQIDPNRFNADHATYFRLTRWRQTRAVVQILANMGAEFAMDQVIFAPADRPMLQMDGCWQAAVLSSSTAADDPVPDLQSVKSTWQTLEMPSPWERLGAAWEETDQDVLLQREFQLPEGWTGADLTLSLGKIDDCDLTYINGFCISEQEEKAPWPHNFPRVYRIPAAYLKPEKNLIHVLLYDRKRKYDRVFGGGFCGPADQMFLAPIQDGYYHLDYRHDFVYGDDPYRYFNW